jgi:hypothetical protein
MNIKKPPSFASRFQSSIAKTEGMEGTSEVRITFSDESSLSFQAVSGNSVPVVNGEKTTLASEFATNVNKFTFLAAGVQMAFKDGSSCNINFGRVIAAAPL